MTDQFKGEGDADTATRADAILPALSDEYARAYYGALIKERRARAYWNHGRPALAYDWLVDALHGFDRAATLRPPGNDDALLRWNACVRLLERMPAPSRDHHEEAAILSE